MSNAINPTDIARETLRLLALKKLPPTPENYRRMYRRVAGQEDDTASDPTTLIFSRFTKETAARHPALAEPCRLLDAAILQKRWSDVAPHLADLLERAAVPQKVNGKPLAELLRNLMTQWQRQHVSMNASRKQAMLDRVLREHEADREELLEKLAFLVRSWSDSSGSAVAEPEPDHISVHARPVIDSVPADAWQRVGELIADILRAGIAAQLDHAPELAQQVLNIAEQARGMENLTDFEVTSSACRQLWMKLAMNEDTDQAVQEGLVRLLRLLIDNIGELIEDDRWLAGQIQVIRQVIEQPPSSRNIHEAERGLKNVIVKQANMQHSLTQAKNTFKTMISRFISQLGAMAETTGEYHGKIDQYAQQITAAEDIQQLGSILEALMNDTRAVQLDMQRSHDEISSTQQESAALEDRVRQLEAELVAISEKMREDVLTGALNRRGLDEAFLRESARAERSRSHLSIALLDLDDFKKLNDTHGHQAGDNALVHLVMVVQSVLRPSDIVARYGGEEFIILLTGTDIEAAKEVMTRLQRELTKRYFLHDQERLLVTFSAGIAEWRVGESQESVIERADRAMYQAKQTGKNKVVISAD